MKRTKTELKAQVISNEINSISLSTVSQFRREFPSTAKLNDFQVKAFIVYYRFDFTGKEFEELAGINAR